MRRAAIAAKKGRQRLLLDGKLEIVFETPRCRGDVRPSHERFMFAMGRGLYIRKRATNTRRAS